MALHITSTLTFRVDGYAPVSQEEFVRTARGEVKIMAQALEARYAYPLYRLNERELQAHYWLTSIGIHNAIQLKEFAERLTQLAAYSPDEGAGNLCRRCGRELHRPESIKRHLGAECATKILGLGVVSKRKVVLSGSA